MSVLLSVGLILLSLSILVVIHELGHFWAARIFKMRVEAFALFFGPTLLKYKKGDTEWQINSVPIGGYVKISGMLDEHLDKEQMDKEPQPWEFRSKPRWQRLIVMLGGIIMNIILGFFIVTMVKLGYGDMKVRNDKVEAILVADSSLAWEQGLRTGDKLVNYNDEPIEYFSDFETGRFLFDSEKKLEILRNGQKKIVEISDDVDLMDLQGRGESFFISIDGKPLIDVVDEKDREIGGLAQAFPGELAGLKDGDLIVAIDSQEFGMWSEVQAYLRDKPLQSHDFKIKRGDQFLDFTIKSDSNSKIGFGLDSEPYRERVHYSFGEAVSSGISQALGDIRINVLGLKGLFSGKVNPAKSVSGPVKIGAMMGKGFAAGGWENFWRITGLLSLVLAIMNLLPIPVLDGGHVVMLTVESIIGRDIPPKTKLIILNIGLYLVIGLMVFVFLNDIINLF